MDMARGSPEALPRLARIGAMSKAVAMRPLIDLAYRVRRRAMALVGWRTSGAKAMVFDADGALLLVRNRYGRTDRWLLPGGGIKRGEAPAAAAAREVREETACVLTEVTPIGVYVHLFRATTRSTAVPDGTEVAEARFFPLDALPEGVSPATRRRIEELAGTRAPNGRW
jgi:8-oxo-dGTP pyrophosphatase MutT (NUDIX family)